jgi:DNA-binding CsgD family transcriptional regulator
MGRAKSDAAGDGSVEVPQAAPRPADEDDAFELPPPPGLRASAVELRGDQYLVLSFPAPIWNLPNCLTAAERDVALAVLRGETNETIARDRDTSIRTVANQIAAIFAKLGVNSRIELACALEASRSEQADRSNRDL